MEWLGFDQPSHVVSLIQLRTLPRISPREDCRPKRVQSRRRGRRALHFLLLCGIAIASLKTTTGQNQTQETFTLSGTVVNSATGEPIPHALVRTAGSVLRNTFTDSEGHFQFDGVPQGQVMLRAQKPGYSAEQEGDGQPSPWINVGPNAGAAVLKLVPQSAVYGRITDSSGQPLEYMPVRLSARAIRDGRREWEARGMTMTDEDGHFRFANLMPGMYFIAAGPREGERRLSAGEKQKTGFAHTYYPGVPDIGSAAPIQVSAGQQAEADLSLSAVSVYRVSGSVTGQMPDQGVGFQVFTASGDEISLPTNFNMETDSFNLESIPAGQYVLRALSQAGLQQLRAELRLNVTSDLENLRLALAPMTSIPVNVRMEKRTSSGESSSVVNVGSQAIVRLLPADSFSPESTSYMEQGGSGRGMVLQGVNPGTYSVQLDPVLPWYVQSASYGPANILTEDITIAAGGATYPIDIVLRDDSASLSGNIRGLNEKQPTAIVVLLPQSAPKLVPRADRTGAGEFTVMGLAPGEYLVFAFDRVEGLEYRNPDVMQAYASQAAHVTLSPSQKAQVNLDLIHVGKSE